MNLICNYKFEAGQFLALDSISLSFSHLRSLTHRVYSLIEDMVKSNTSTSAEGSSRLMTFETGEEEQLLVRAGVSEVNSHMLYQCNVTDRYVVVPVDKFVGDDGPRRGRDRIRRRATDR